MSAYDMCTLLFFGELHPIPGSRKPPGTLWEVSLSSSFFRRSCRTSGPPNKADLAYSRFFFLLIRRKPHHWLLYMDADPLNPDDDAVCQY